MPGNDNFLALLDQIEELGELSFRRVDADGHDSQFSFIFSLIKRAVRRVAV